MISNNQRIITVVINSDSSIQNASARVLPLEVKYQPYSSSINLFIAFKSAWNQESSIFFTSLEFTKICQQQSKYHRHLCILPTFSRVFEFTSQDHNDHNITHHKSYSPQLYRHTETMGPKPSLEMAVKLQSMRNVCAII